MAIKSATLNKKLSYILGERCINNGRFSLESGFHAVEADETQRQRRQEEDDTMGTKGRGEIGGNNTLTLVLLKEILSLVDYYT